MPKIPLFGSKSGAQRMRRDVNTVLIEGNRVPDLKRGENFLSSSIQYIYRLTYQSASLTFKCHANCIKKIEGAPVSPSYIINRIAFLLHHLFTVHYLLLEKKRYELTFFLQNDAWLIRIVCIWDENIYNTYFGL